MATRRDRRAARAKPSPAALSRDLAASRDRILGLEDRLSATFEKVFRQAGRAAAKKFEDAATAHVIASAAPHQTGPYRATPHPTSPHPDSLTATGWTPPDIDEVVDVDAIVAGLHTKADPIRRSAIREYGAALEGVANWDTSNPLAAGVLAGAAQHVTDIADTTRLNVMRTIKASYEEGLSIPDTAKAIQAGMEAASAARGRLIARTELAAVANGGSLAATQIFADATGDTLYKRWLTAPGAKEPRHEDYEGLDGTTVGLDDAFDVGGYQLQFPGDPDGPPEEICNCRCSLIYVSTPSEEVTPAGPPPDPVDEDLSTVLDVSDAVPTAEAGIEAAASDEMSVVLGGDAVATQAALRAGNLDADLNAAVKKVDVAIGGSVLDRGAVTLRGVSDLKPMFGEGWPPKVGDIAYDPAYASTTTDPRVAKQFAGPWAPGGAKPDSGYVTYHSAPGQNGLWVPGITNPEEGWSQTEKELLLPRGLPLRVIGVGERDGLPDIHVEVVGRGVTPGVAEYGKLAEVALEPLTGDTPYSLAGPVLRNAARSEAQVTAALRAAVEPRGGYFEGLPFRVKSAPSVARKIELIQVEKKVPLEAAATGIKDGLRYTAVFEPESYVRDVTSALDELKAKAGIVPERISPTWKKGADYVGTNVVMRAPNGLRFELQFHTPQSFDVKERVNHSFYQQARRLGTPDAEVARLNALMVKNADGVVRPPGILEWKYEASVEADIGVTPFRAAADDPFGFYDSQRFKTFERHAEKIASSYGVEIDAKLKVPSVWEGVEEPGVSIHAHDGEKGVAAFAADLGKVYDQDGVLLFSPTLGDDIIATFDGFQAGNHEKVLAAMERAGLPGARFLEDGRLQIIGSGPEFVAQLDAVGRDLGVGYDSALGRFSLLQKVDGDYEAALRDFASAEGKQVRARGTAVEEHGGTPLVGPGAPGGQGAAQQAVAGFGAAPLPHVPHWAASEVKAMTDDELWGALAINGKIDNLARADVTAVESRRLRAEVTKRIEKGGLFEELAGDNQVHSTFSDGHSTIRELALAAQKRGATQMVISDHGHLMTSADVARQHRQIDKLNRELAPFKILKGVEVSILENGTLDLAEDALAKFDVVNAAIHGTEAVGGQQVLFARPATERFLNALVEPRLTVLVHPHAVRADWDAVATKAAEKHVALEINGRSLLRADSADEAAKMIDAAKRHGAKLAIGSDAHSAGDLIDAAYAARFAADHGVVADDIVSFQRRGGSLVPDPSTTLPGDREITLGRVGSSRLGGGMNVVWKVEKGDMTLVVKPEPDPQRLRDLGMDTENPIRENVLPGFDLERERAAYVVSRYFNEVGGSDFHVYVPPYRISEIIQPNALGRAEVPAGVATFIPGEVGIDSYGWSSEIADRGLEEEGRSAGLFDAVIGNTDRHAGNFIFGDDDHLWLIDHGLAFPEGVSSGDFENTMLMDDAVVAFGPDLTSGEVAFLERLRDRWQEVEKEMVEAGIPADASNEMKVRLDYMIEEKTRRGWPHGSDLW